MPTPETQVCTIRLPDSLVDRIKALADEQERSFNWQVRQALETFFEQRDNPVKTVLPPFPESDFEGSGAEFRATLRWYMPNFADDIEKGLLGTETRIRDSMPEIVEVMRRYGAKGDIAITDIDRIGSSRLPGTMIFPVSGPTIVQTPVTDDELFFDEYVGGRDPITAASVLEGWKEEGERRKVLSRDTGDAHLAPPFNTARQEEHMKLVERAAGGDREAMAALGGTKRRYEGITGADVRVGDLVVVPDYEEPVRVTFVEEVTATESEGLGRIGLKIGQWFLRFENLDTSFGDSLILEAHDTLDRVVFDDIDWDVAEHTDEYEKHMRHAIDEDGVVTPFGRPDNVVIEDEPVEEMIAREMAKEGKGDPQYWDVQGVARPVPGTQGGMYP